MRLATIYFKIYDLSGQFSFIHTLEMTKLTEIILSDKILDSSNTHMSS